MSDPNHPIRVLIVDDHQVVRQGLRALLEGQPELTIVDEAIHGLDALQACREHPIDLVIMDIAMSHMNGIEATRSICAEYPHIRVLALSVHSQKRYIQEILRAGARGYLLKTCLSDEILTAIHTVMAGQVFICSELSNMAMADYADQLKSREKLNTPISPRERQVLQLIAEGKSAKEIGALLDISARTVEMHRAQLMKKLNIKTTAELTRYAIKIGLTPLG